MKHITIHFDGGTPCNIPAKGYGIGYGSYSIDGQEPIRVNHGVPCSNNVAELLTIAVALESLETPEEITARIEGDSQIALKWLDVATGKRKGTKLKNAAPAFVAAIHRAGDAVRRLHSAEMVWRGREHAVARFGH